MTAKIKLNAASGGGSFSLQAPSSSANNRVFTLPDIADATMATVNGITEMDNWRINTNVSNTGVAYLTANWERNDSYFEKIGTGLSESSGVFTFPSTGKYFITYFISMTAGSSTSTYTGGYIRISTDSGSNYTRVMDNFSSISAANAYSTISGYGMLDITNTSTHSVKFEVETQNASTIRGGTDRNQTGFICLKLGDT